MVISVHSAEDGTRVIEIAGELDLATAPRLERELASVESSSPARIVIDLRAVKFIDSTGLRLILAADQRARLAGRMLEIVRGPAHVHRLFGITGLDRRLRFLDGEAS